MQDRFTMNEASARRRPLDLYPEIAPIARVGSGLGAQALLRGMRQSNGKPGVLHGSLAAHTVMRRYH
jgi:hypothetical protein